MIVAVTGANGFIGGHLVQRFGEAGWEVRPIVRSDFSANRVGEIVRRADVVVHAAGATRAATVAELRASNVALTEQLVDSARTGNVKTLIFISSQAAAGPARSFEEPVTERMTAAPVEPYGRSKLDAEAVVGSQSQIAAVIVRPAAVYGPADHDFLALFRLAKHGVAIHPANRDHWLSIVHVDDLVRFILLCATGTRVEDGVFFVANDEPTQWAELFRLGAECAGTPLHVDANLPEPVAAAGAFIGDVAARLTGHVSLMTSGKLALSKPRYWICSNERAKGELSFTPCIDLGTGMRATYDWYVSHGWL